MKIQATIRWSTWGTNEHGHGYRSAWVEKVPQGFVLDEGKLFPVYDDEVPQYDALLALIRTVEDGIENVRKNGQPGWSEVWYNREMFEINFRACPEKGEPGRMTMTNSFWANEGWREHVYD